MILNDVGSLFKNIGKFVKSIFRSNYGFGHSIADRLTSNKGLGGTVDVLAGGGLTYFFGLQTVSRVIAAGVAIAGAVTGAVAVPAALLTVGASVLFGALSGIMLALGVGFLADAKDKIRSSISGPSASGSHAFSHVAQTVFSPFKWASRKLSHMFKRAHDGTRNFGDDLGSDFNPKVRQPRP